MIKLITFTFLTFTSVSFAESLKFQWNHNNVDDTSHLPITISKFTLHWGSVGGPLSTALDFSTPTPWKMDLDGTGHYSKTIVDDRWVKNTTMCFALSAWSGSSESAYTPTICMVVTPTPKAPTGFTIL